MIGLSVYLITDTIFIAKGMGEKGLAALNLAIPVYNVMMAVGLMMAVGSAQLFNEFLVKRDEVRTKLLLKRIVSITLRVGLGFVLFGIFCNKWMAGILQANAETMDMTSTYVRYVFIFSPAFMLNSIVMVLVRNDGEPGLSTMAMITGSLFNVLFDYIFIFPCHMGMLGAVLATGFSPVSSLCVLSLHFIRKKSHFSIPKSLVFHTKDQSLKKESWSMLRKTVVLGTPTFIDELAVGVLMAIFNAVFLRLAGNTGVAAYGIVTNAYLVVQAIFNGLSQGVQPLMAKSYAMKNLKDLEKIRKMGIGTAIGIAAIIVGIILLWADPIVAIFNRDQNPVLQSQAVEGIQLYFLAAFGLGINIVFSIYYVSSRHPVKAQILTVLRAFVGIIPVILLMAKFFGVTGAYLALPLTEMVVAISVNNSMSCHKLALTCCHNLTHSFVSHFD